MIVQSPSGATEDDVAPGAQDAATFESQGGRCVDTLGVLMEKAEARLDIAKVAETTNVHIYEL